MGDIKTTRFPKKGITVKTVRGPISTEEIHKWIVSQDQRPLTPHIVWDMRKANVERITSRHVKEIFNTSRPIAEKRLGKTALIVGDEAAHGLTRLYTTHTDMSGIDNEHRIFGDLTKALEWMGEDEQ